MNFPDQRTDNLGGTRLGNRPLLEAFRLHAWYFCNQKYFKEIYFFNLFWNWISNKL